MSPLSSQFDTVGYIYMYWIYLHVLDIFTCTGYIPVYIVSGLYTCTRTHIHIY